MDHLVINSTTDVATVATEAKVSPALPATAVVEFMAKWLKLYPRTVSFTNFGGPIFFLAFSLRLIFFGCGRC